MKVPVKMESSILKSGVKPLPSRTVDPSKNEQSASAVPNKAVAASKIVLSEQEKEEDPERPNRVVPKLPSKHMPKKSLGGYEEELGEPEKVSLTKSGPKKAMRMRGKAVDNLNRPKSMGFTTSEAAYEGVPISIPFSAPKSPAPPAKSPGMLKGAKTPGKAAKAKNPVNRMNSDGVVLAKTTVSETDSKRVPNTPEIRKKNFNMLRMPSTPQFELDSTVVRSTAPLFVKDPESPNEAAERGVLSLDLGTLDREDRSELGLKRKEAPKALDKETLKKLENLNFKLPGMVDLDRFKVKESLAGGKKRSNSHGDAGADDQSSEEDESELEKKKLSEFWLPKEQKHEEWEKVKKSSFLQYIFFFIFWREKDQSEGKCFSTPRRGESKLPERMWS